MAEQTLNVTVVDVTSRSGTSKKTNKPYTLYFFDLSDGNQYKAFGKKGAELAATAQEAKRTGATVEARVHDEPGQEGYGPDLFLDDLEGVPAVSGAVQQADFTPTPIQSSNGSSREDNIRAQMAFKLAGLYYANNGSGDVETDLPLIESMAKVIYQKATADALTASESPREPATQQW